MLTLSADISQYLFSSAMIFVRISAAILTMPLLGSKMIPPRIKIIVCIALTMIAYTAINTSESKQYDLNFGYWAISILYQSMIGFVFGFVIQILFQTFMMAGQIIAMQMGLGFAQLMDPQNGVSVPAIGQFYTILVSLLFLSLNGHLFLISSIIESFEALPIHIVEFQSIDTQVLVGLGGTLFLSSLKIALPAVIALLITNLAFGVMTKASPQINIFSLGFSVTLIVGLAVVLVTSVFVAPEFTQLSDNLRHSLIDILKV